LNSESEEIETVAQINTGSQEYELTDSTLIGLSIKNISSSPIYYNTCDIRTIEEIENEEVTQSVIFTNPCKCNCVVTLQSNEEKELYVKGYFITQNRDKLKLKRGVKYKILPHFYKDKKQEKRISLSAVNSKQFTLTSQ
jgi:hypothetical protein